MYKNLPPQLTRHENFILWRLTEKEGEKPKKTPVNPRTGHTSGANIALAVTFEEAIARKRQHKNISGIGFVLTAEAKITCIDFDGVLDEQGNLLPEYEPIGAFIKELGKDRCYAEKSQSKKGLHVFVQGTAPGSRTRSAKAPFPVEIYSSNRYIAVTGDLWHPDYANMHHEPEMQQQILNKLYFELFPEDLKTVSADAPVPTTTGGPEKILQLLKHAANAARFNALYSGGGLSEDRSADDLALANMFAFYTQNPAEIEQLMRGSALVRPKWDRDSYLQRTIERAVSGQTVTYDWAELERREAEWRERQSQGRDEAPLPEGLELVKPVKNKPEKAEKAAKPRKKSNAVKIAEAEEFIRERYLVYKNVVNGFVYLAPKESGGNYIQMTDHERSTLFLELQRADIELSESNFDHILKSDSIPQKNPLEEFFLSLPEWDGFDHIGAYIANSIIPADRSIEGREQNQLFIKKWLVGIPACAMSKTTVNDLCLILKGPQGIGKSTWFKYLLPEFMADYSVILKISDKSTDTGMIICSSLICNMDELEDLSKRDDGEIKRLISQKVFTLRKPYDRLPNNYCRYTSFCGTTNDSTFLKDQTGNRRYIVLDLEKLNFETIKKYDKIKLWAQIYHEYKAGFQYWLTQEENSIVSARNSAYAEKTPEEELLLSKFKPGTKDNWTHRMNSTQLLQYLDIKKIDNRAIKNMGVALAKNGFVQGKAKIKSLISETAIPLRVWYLNELPKEVGDYEYE